MKAQLTHICVQVFTQHIDQMRGATRAKRGQREMPSRTEHHKVGPKRPRAQYIERAAHAPVENQWQRAGVPDCWQYVNHCGRGIKLAPDAKANIKAIVKGMFGEGQEYYLFVKLS